MPYRGRFAPSPTGPLHFGSLVAAVASYLDARASSGEWLVRMEDVDRARERPGAAGRILADLDRFGFAWDGPILRQSDRVEAYREAFRRLDTFPCACSRKETSTAPCICARGLPSGKQPRAWRLRDPADPVSFDDRVFGCQSATLDEFVVLRADGIFAYQLAVVVDDAFQSITDVVRGADLLDSTPRQIALQRLLGLSTPRYLHVPVAADAAGAKLSKQTRATALRPGAEAAQLCAVLRFLGQNPPSALSSAPVPEVWSWAIANWSVSRIPRVHSLPAALA
jgi:glutamyl-Q tRNA(Asp) synthetase